MRRSKAYILCTIVAGLLALNIQIRGTAAQALACIDRSGDLVDGWAVTNGACIDSSESVFFYGVRSGPYSTMGLTGLQAGAPTNLQLLFGSAGRPVDEALDPSNFGLSIPDGGKLNVEFSAGFIYDTETALSPTPNVLVDLGVSSENQIFGDSCPYTGAQAATVCGGWTSALRRLQS
jgi:hypothetical protein